MPRLALLAGGKASRLHPLTHNTPKLLVPILGRPFADHLFTRLKSEGVAKVTILAGHMSDQIIDHVGGGDRYGLEIDYNIDGAAPLGTGGAVGKFCETTNEPFFLMYGDSYLVTSYKDIHRSYLIQSKSCVMTVYENHHKYDVSNIELQNGTITAYKKNSPTNMTHIDYGISVLNPATIRDLKLEVTCDLSSIFQQLIIKQQLGAHEVEERFYEIGSHDGISDLEDYFKMLNGTKTGN